MSDSLKKITVGFLEVNCYLVPSEKDQCVYIIDPGALPEKIAETAESFGFKDYKILLTHGHIDHISAVKEVMQLLPVSKLYLHPEEILLYNSPGNELPPLMPAVKDLPQPDDDFDSSDFSIIHTPGHTKGGVCFYFEGIPAIFSGDTLFNDSIGRTDLPSGNAETLLKSIKEKLFVLPDDLTVFPGHGRETKIGKEKTHNPFLA